MLDIKIISILLEKINENLNEFYDYVNSNIRKDINIRENLDFLEEENLINKEIKYSISGDIFYANNLHLTSKGLRILNSIKNGNINNLEDLYDFYNTNINISIENKPVFSNNPNINVSPIINNISNSSNYDNTKIGYNPIEKRKNSKIKIDIIIFILVILTSVFIICVSNILKFYLKNEIINYIERIALISTSIGGIVSYIANRYIIK
ncbi:hypothetical protein [Brachyspira hyodysenteriae]|uniref:hypothetical protein n=1 Tax=Brachyspira hyodysenteriae TaxID=159 RepID=UPI00063DB0DA|nr:hypothetical protein [Brachyspira hyodysenteriae]KLI52811.1 hypothetical protein SZ42_02770 [Brachyspira hyodysenteriae]